MYIKDFIQDDLKAKEEMKTAVRYYNVEHDILKHNFNEFEVDGLKIIDPNQANQKVAYGFFSLLVDQKVQYIVGKPTTVNSNNEELNEKINEMLQEKFDYVLTDWVEGSSIKGVEWLHPYIDEEGNFDYVIIPAEQIIPIYDMSYKKQLERIIRYYLIDYYEGEKKFKRYRVEEWTASEVVYYIETESGDFVEEYRKPHWVIFNTAFPDSIESRSWGKIPFIELKNNSRKKSDLHRIKRIIDAYDLINSGAQNNQIDIQLAIWVLKGYSGTDLSEFMQNLKKYKAMKVDERGSVESQSIQIPIESQKFMLAELEKKIYELGQGVDMGVDSFGAAPSGIALNFLYSGLDGKSNKMILNLKSALKEFMWFVIQYINERDNTNYENDTWFSVNKTMLTNETEKIQNAANSVGIVSMRTIRENHPFVDDVNWEKEQLQKEQKERMNEILSQSVGDIDDDIAT